MGRMSELWDWLVSLDPVFRFLLALPFVVVIAAFVGEYLRRLKRRPRAERHKRQ
jgi:hypothetical protein